MISITESVTITASPSVIWTQLVDLERWWTASNPDHIRLEIQSPDKSVGEDTQVEFEERVGGVRIVATGRIVSLHENSEATWEGTATYRCLGFRVRVERGIKWRIASMSDLAIVSASVWSVFPVGLVGRFMGWYAKKSLKMAEREREHARDELEYLKGLVEADGARDPVLPYKVNNL